MLAMLLMGLMVGTILGVVVTCVLQVAGRADEALECQETGVRRSEPDTRNYDLDRAFSHSRPLPIGKAPEARP